LLGAVSATLLLSLAACSESPIPVRPPGAAGAPGGPNAPGMGMPGAQNVNVVTAEVTLGELGLEIEAIGNAVANESAEITSKSVNTVTAIHFEEGQFVRKGTVLVELDSAQVRADLAAAEAALAESRSQYNRSKELVATNVISASQMDQLEAALKTNEAKVAAAKARLEDTIIRAPFSGRIGFRRISVGGLVNPGTVICTIDDTSVMKLDFTVPQSYMFGIAPGTPITAQIAGVPNRTFQGRITTLDSRVDPVTRSIVVRAELPNPDGVLKPGMFMTAKINAGVAQALLVPEGAIVPEQGRTFVFVVKDGVAFRREVTLGRRRVGQVQIATGVTAGERVIVEGTQKVRDGIAVVEVPGVGATVADAEAT